LVDEILKSMNKIYTTGGILWDLQKAVLITAYF
jgi:hypothetical protein